MQFGIYDLTLQSNAGFRIYLKPLEGHEALEGETNMEKTKRIWNENAK